MIKTARQLKDLVRNLSKGKAADAQILMRNYMNEILNLTNRDLMEVDGNE